MARVGRHIAALASGVVGFYLGLIVALELLGLQGGAEAFPLFTAAGAGAAIGPTLGLFDGRARFGARAVTGIVTGMALGAVLWAIELELEWHVAALALMSQGLAWWASPEQIGGDSERQTGHSGI